MALFIARQGTLAAAGHQIAANIAAVLYMVPLSFAIATSARVSYWRGAGNEMRARQAVLTGFGVSSFASIALAAILFIAKSRIASVYSQQTEVVLLTAGLLAWVAAYHLVDAVQILCIFLLRCYRITLAPLVVYGGMLWGLGLGGGYWMAYHGLGPLAPLRSPTPFWAASSAALGVTAAVFAWMLARALKAAQRQR
jgi:MATE family multidrug resistance protein